MVLATSVSTPFILEERLPLFCSSESEDTGDKLESDSDDGFGRVLGVTESIRRAFEEEFEDDDAAAAAAAAVAAATAVLMALGMRILNGDFVDDGGGITDGGLVICCDGGGLADFTEDNETALT